jgi:hypothetical protein
MNESRSDGVERKSRILVIHYFVRLLVTSVLWLLESISTVVVRFILRRKKKIVCDYQRKKLTL